MYLLPPAYAAPIVYYYYLSNFPCEIEVCGTYQKQTYANRCLIAASNGVMPLIIPVENHGKPAYKDIRISNHSDWQMLHFKALASNYYSSPFFEYFGDDIFKIYQKKYDFLIDFNNELQDLILNLLNYKSLDISLSTEYKKYAKSIDFDLRKTLLAKKTLANLPNNLTKEYYQVFSAKIGFIENLSIFDLLFNLGNEARIYLKSL
jgi:hypothetical protein